MLYLACAVCKVPVRDDPCTGAAAEHGACAGSNRPTQMLEWPPYEHLLRSVGEAPSGARSEALKIFSVAHKLTDAERRLAAAQLSGLLAI